MTHWLDLAWLGPVAVLASFVGSVAGSGGSTVLLPVLVLVYGVQDAIPIIAIANISANLSRVALNWREIAWPVVGWFALGALPFSMLGAWLFTVTAPGVLVRLLGVLLLTVVVWRRLHPTPPVQRNPRWFLPLGGLFGVLEGIMGSVGPLMAPFFLAFGLLRNAYIGTDALATVVMQGTKLAVFGSFALLGAPILTAGLSLVPFMIAGTVLGRRLLRWVPERGFVLLVESVLVLAGLNFLLRGAG